MSGFQGKKGTRPSQYFATLLQAGIPARRPNRLKQLSEALRSPRPPAPEGSGWLRNVQAAETSVVAGRVTEQDLPGAFSDSILTSRHRLDRLTKSTRPAKVPVPRKSPFPPRGR